MKLFHWLAVLLLLGSSPAFAGYCEGVPIGVSVSDVSLSNCVKLPGTFTIATLPNSTSIKLGTTAFTSDGGVYVLESVGWTAIGGGSGIGPGSVGNLCILTTTTNCTGLAGGTTGNVLTWNGTAWVSGAGTTYPGLPSNSVVAASDLIAGYPSGGPLGTYAAGVLLGPKPNNLGTITGTTIAPDCSLDREDNYGTDTATGGTLTVSAPTGSPAEGWGCVIHLKSTNPQTYSWASAYVGGTTALPTTLTGSSKGDWIAFRYDSINAKWDYVATATGF